jgi:hypothetical protein
VIVVLEAHDVILAEIAAGLDLDQFEVDLARIFEAMPGAAGHVDRLVLVQESDIVANCHPRGAARPPSARRGGDASAAIAALLASPRCV